MLVLLLACASRPPDPPAPVPLPVPIERHRDTVVADDGHELTVWSKLPDHPRGAVLLLHGRTWSGVPDFDLEVPGHQRSALDAFVARGFAAYALDLRGYGGTARDEGGWDTPDRAADDVAAAVGFVTARHPDLPRPVLVGWSLGSFVAHLYAQRHPDALSALVLYGFSHDVDSPISADGIPPDAAPPRRPNTEDSATSDFVTPGSIDPETVAAYVQAALAADPVRADWRSMDELNELDPSLLVLPTMVIHGANDPSTSFASQSHLFGELGTQDREWVVLPDADHAAILEDAMPMLVDDVVAFATEARSGR